MNYRYQVTAYTEAGSKLFFRYSNDIRDALKQVVNHMFASKVSWVEFKGHKYMISDIYRMLDPSKRNVCSLILVLFLIIPSISMAGLGKNEKEFQAIKAQIVESIKGSEATVSEVKTSTFTDEEKTRIARAIQQLK